ncbi:MAG: cupin domain-containing protein [Solirubrobacterales bacterium]
MYAFQTQDLELAEVSSPGDETREVRAAFPLYHGTGSASTSMVYFELEPEMHLGSHIDSAEEVLVVLEGEVEATIDGESGRVRAGGMALVPAMVPHDVRNAGDETAKVAGLFSSNTMVAVFEEEFSMGGMPPSRVNGTPPPEQALAEPQAA